MAQVYKVSCVSVDGDITIHAFRDKEQFENWVANSEIANEDPEGVMEDWDAYGSFQDDEGNTWSEWSEDSYMEDHTHEP